MTVEYGDMLTPEEVAALEIELDDNGTEVVEDEQTTEAPTEPESKPEAEPNDHVVDNDVQDSPEDTSDAEVPPEVTQQESTSEVVIPHIVPMVRPDVVEPVDTTEQLKELADKYDAGDMTLAEYTSEANKLHAQNVLAEQSKQLQEHFAKQEWANTTAAFFSSNPQFDQEKNPVMYDLFSARYNRLIAEEKNLTGIDALVKAGEQTLKDVAALTGTEKASKQPMKVKPKKAEPTQSLADVPSAKEGETSSNKFSDLDALTGEAFEEALQKLTPAQQREYLSA